MTPLRIGKTETGVAVLVVVLPPAFSGDPELNFLLKKWSVVVGSSVRQGVKACHDMLGVLGQMSMAKRGCIGSSSTL